MKHKILLALLSILLLSLPAVSQIKLEGTFYGMNFDNEGTTHLSRAYFIKFYNGKIIAEDLFGGSPGEGSYKSLGNSRYDLWIPGWGNAKGLFRSTSHVTYLAFYEEMFGHLVLIVMSKKKNLHDWYSSKCIEAIADFNSIKHDDLKKK